jgi:hypothetical protein
MLSESEPTAALGAIIEELTQKLLDYSRTQAPSKAYIDRQRLLVSRLTDIYNSQHRLNFHNHLFLIDQQLCKLLADSPEIDGVVITLNLCSAPRNIACIALTCP